MPTEQEAIMNLLNRQEEILSFQSDTHDYIGRILNMVRELNDMIRGQAIEIANLKARVKELESERGDQEQGPGN